MDSILVSVLTKHSNRVPLVFNVFWLMEELFLHMQQSYHPWKSMTAVGHFLSIACCLSDAISWLPNCCTSKVNFVPSPQNNPGNFDTLTNLENLTKHWRLRRTQIMSRDGWVWLIHAQQHSSDNHTLSLIAWFETYKISLGLLGCCVTTGLIPNPSMRSWLHSILSKKDFCL